MIDFFKRTVTDSEIDNIQKWHSRDGVIPDYRKMSRNYFVDQFNYPNFFLTKSCTQSLELAITICRFEPGDEIILPSYAFVSLANSVALRGLKCVFVDCERDTMNIDPNAIEGAISEKTRAIITINYGGVSCDYSIIRPLCDKYNLILIEDNAHGIRAKYNGEWLGSIGDISTISFDFLKSISCNEGGGITINNEALLNQFRISYEFGTNKMDFLDKKVPYYEWKATGSNHALAEQLAAILYSQLEHSEKVVNEFKRKWKIYYERLAPLEKMGFIRLLNLPSYSETNGYMFWIKSGSNTERNELMSHLSKNNIHTAFHYTPLHSSEYGKKTGVFRGNDTHTSNESSRLLRLPLYYSISESDILLVTEEIYRYYKVPIK